MDDMKFIEEWKRMCNSFEDCDDCPLNENCDDDVVTTEMARLVKEWSAAHPRKTRQSVFLEKYPNADLNEEGIVNICPKGVDKNHDCELNRPAGCYACRRKFWMKGVE